MKEAEEMQREQGILGDKEWEAIKDKGPPQWFVDAINERKATKEEEGEQGGAREAEPPPPAAKKNEVGQPESSSCKGGQEGVAAPICERFTESAVPGS